MVCLICPRLPVMYWNAPYCCVQIFACLKKKKPEHLIFALKKKHSNCSFLLFFFFFCKTGCFSEATLLCNLSLSQNTFYSYDGGGWVSPPQYFTIPVVLKLHCLLLVVSALQWQHLISCCKPPATFNFLPDRLSYCIWGLHCIACSLLWDSEWRRFSYYKWTDVM